MQKNMYSMPHRAKAFNTPYTYLYLYIHAAKEKKKKNIGKDKP